MSGLQCEKTNIRKDLSIFVCTAYSDENAEEIQHFVAEGGGLLIGGHAWYWAQTNWGQNPLTDFPGTTAQHPQANHFPSMVCRMKVWGVGQAWSRA